jgi:hypothetical protein
MNRMTIMSRKRSRRRAGPAWRRRRPVARSIGPPVHEGAPFVALGRIGADGGGAEANVAEAGSRDRDRAIAPRATASL